MASGYTADIADLKPVSFKEFASKCAYAFMIEGRDHHDDALPDKPYDYDNGYHAKKLEKAQEALDSFLRLSYDDIAEQNSAEYNKQLNYWSEQTKKNVLIVNAYNKMIDEVEAWTPPTENHQGLKDFMLQQLRDSLEFDSHEPTAPVRVSTEEFKLNKIESLNWNLNYHKESLEKAKVSYASRLEWLNQLKKSIGV